MQDRIPTPGQEGRVLITPEDGSAPFFATVEMADNPTQAGTPLNKETLLQDGTEAEIFGNTANRTVDEAFMGIMGKIALIMQNVASMTLTVTDTAGTPLQEVYVSGVFDEDGNAVATNASGQITGYVAEGDSTLSITGYADIAPYSEIFTAVKGQSYTKTIQVTTRNFLKITSTQNVKFSGNVARLDVSVGSGGGGAGGGVCEKSGAATGGGGAGGYVTTQENVDFEPNTPYVALVGSGGTGAPIASISSPGKRGGNGGQSSFLGVIANGGNGGEAAQIVGYPNYVQPGIGGNGNGNGANGASLVFGDSSNWANGNDGLNGTQEIFSSFVDTEPYGGGGGTGVVGIERAPSSAIPGNGGSPGGGKGGKWAGTLSGESGSAGKGGGGGSGLSRTYEHADQNEASSGGSGGSGCIAIRMHLASAA